MKKIISYDELPSGNGQSIYLRMETDPKLYMTLFTKEYKMVHNYLSATKDTIYITGKRQAYECSTSLEYKNQVDEGIKNSFKNKDITKPKTSNFSYTDLIYHKYKLPFVFKNENQNGGREKFLIKSEKDYQSLIDACSFLLSDKVKALSVVNPDDIRYNIDYKEYLDNNFTIQEYIETPSRYNTTVRLLTSASNDLLYASLKYNEKETLNDNTSLLGYLLSDVYPLSTKSIVSNTLSGGKNILLGEKFYINKEEKTLLNEHNINSYKFYDLVKSTEDIHAKYKRELGIICGFDYIYDKEKDKWFLLEYHSRPMVGDYAKRNKIDYNTPEERIIAEGRVRATALSLILNKKN